MSTWKWTECYTQGLRWCAMGLLDLDPSALRTLAPAAPVPMPDLLAYIGRGATIAPPVVRPVVVPPIFDAIAPPREFRLAIVGAKHFKDYVRFVATVSDVVARHGAGKTLVLVTSGEGGFVDRYGAQHGVNVVQYTPNWSVHGKQAVWHRNRQLMAAAHALVTYADGASSTIVEMAQERGLPVYTLEYATAEGHAPPTTAKAPGDLTRILALPSTDGIVVPDQTERYLRLGITRDTAEPGPLKAVQSHALYWAERQGGLVGAIGVGGGKTLTSFLLPVAMKALTAVLFVPPHLYRKTLRDFGKLRLYWTLPELGDYRQPAALPLHDGPLLYIVSMGQLSTAANSDLMDRLEPDLVIVDEAHYLRGNKSARSKRFARYFLRRPATRAALLSGTLTNSSLSDYWHLCKWALKSGSPLPLTAHTAQVYDALLGTKNEQQRAAEATARGIDLPAASYLRDIAKRYCEWAQVDDMAEAFRRRLVSTPGWVATATAECDAGLVIVERTCPVPPAVQAAIARVQSDWCLPDGNEFESALQLEHALTTLSAGYYNIWQWPNDIIDTEWLDARRNWARAVRTVLARNLQHLDSPLLVERACARGDERIRSTRVELDAERWVGMMDLWETWKQVKNRPEPDTKVVWISTFLCEAAISLARTIKGGVVLWYETPAVGDVLAELTGWPRFGAGDADSRALVDLAERTLSGAVETQPIIASILCHGTGKNLQGWSRAIVVQTPGRGDTVEQLLGRLHREGQQADEVTFDWYVHTEWARKSMAKARVEAEYQERTLGQPQRLLLATVESGDDFDA